MLENRSRYALVGDLRDRLYPPAAARTPQHVDRKHPLHELWPPKHAVDRRRAARAPRATVPGFEHLAAAVAATSALLGGGPRPSSTTYGVSWSRAASGLAAKRSARLAAG